jgi:hypothetical protein
VNKILILHQLHISAVAEHDKFEVITLKGSNNGQQQHTFRTVTVAAPSKWFCPAIT